MYIFRKRFFTAATIALAFVLTAAFEACSPKIAKQAALLNSPKFIPVSEIGTFTYDTVAQWELPDDSLYMTHSLPNAVNFLPPPPPFDTTDAIFKGDYARWKWGKTVRPTERGRQASYESLYGIVRMCTIFSEVFGFVIHPDTTPAIYRFMLYAGETGHKATAIPKKTYMRRRPFDLMNEPLWGEFDDESLRGNGSYPSGHTTLGWTTALALADMVPELEDQILKRGYQYGESRVIVGAHWQSDVNAGYVIGAAAFATFQKDPRYQKHLKAARKEYEALVSIWGQRYENFVTP